MCHFVWDNLTGGVKPKEYGLFSSGFKAIYKAISNVKLLIYNKILYLLYIDYINKTVLECTALSLTLPFITYAHRSNLL